MTTITYQALPTETVRAYQRGEADDYGLPPERRVSDGGLPCRHCLGFIDAGEEYLTLAHRPFPALQPYAETGPIFLHAEPCARYEASEVLPPMLVSSDYIVRGYGRDDRILYGTGGVIETPKIGERAEALLGRDEVAYVHVRSSRNNCYQCRIDRV